MAEIDDVYRRLAERQQRRAESGADPAVAATKPSALTAQPIILGLHLDAQIKSLLQAVTKTTARQPGYSNAELATELLQAEHVTVGSHGVGPNRAILQRLALAGKLFAAIAADPALPADFKQSFEGLRFPLIKSALADTNFFTQPTHPLRIIVGEFVQKAAELRMGGAGAARELDEMLQNAAGHFDLAAAFVRPALPKLKPLQAAVIEQFLAQLEKDRVERGVARERRAKQFVRRTIDPQMMGTRLPPLIRFLIEEDMTTLLGRRLLEHGPDSKPFRDGLQLIDEMLKHIPDAESGAGFPDDLLQRMELALREIGEQEGSGLPILRGLRKLASWLVAKSTGKPMATAAAVSSPAAPAPPPVAEPVAPPPPPIEAPVPAFLVAPAATTPVVEPPAATPATKPAVARPAAEAPAMTPKAEATQAAPAPEAPAVTPAAAAPAAVAQTVMETAPPAETKPQPATPAPLDALMRAGRWFRVFDHRNQSIRWLKLEAYYPAQDSIVFAEFDGANPFGIRAQEFLEDLRHGRSSPANPDSETRALLAQIVPPQPSQPAA